MADEALSAFVEQPPGHETTLAQLKSKIFGEGDEQASPSSLSSKPKCPKFPKKLLPDMKDQDYDVPQRISLGPYHHGNPRLARGETLKLKLARSIIILRKLNVDRIYNLICNQVGELKACYEEETAKKFRDGDFTAMMLVDGFALLSYIICVCFDHSHEDYDIGHQDLSLLHLDILHLENQLPYRLLHQLMELVNPISDRWTVVFQEFFGMIDESSFQEFFGMKEKPLLHRMKDYCCQLSLPVIRRIKGNIEPKPGEESQPNSEKGSQPEPEEGLQPNSEEKAKPKPEEESKRYHHLLDLYRTNFLGDDERSSPTPRKKICWREGSHKKDETSVGDTKEQLMASFRNVKELTAAGIRIKPSPTRYLRDISFTTNGITAYLQLPRITIDKSTKTLFLNLIAHEMSSDVPHDFISYLRFLDSLIDHADDVKELQSAEVLQNNLGTHKEVAEFFNTVSAKLDSNFRAYKDVRVKIRKHLKSHYNSKLKRWMTQCLDTYFDSPWTIIAWIVAALVLFLTAVQTYFSAFHR